MPQDEVLEVTSAEQFRFNFSDRLGYYPIDVFEKGTEVVAGVRTISSASASLVPIGCVFRRGVFWEVGEFVQGEIIGRLDHDGIPAAPLPDHG